VEALHPTEMATSLVEPANFSAEQTFDSGEVAMPEHRKSTCQRKSPPPSNSNAICPPKEATLYLKNPRYSGEGVELLKETFRYSNKNTICLEG
jgi:hypothetical protein